MYASNVSGGPVATPQLCKSSGFKMQEDTLTIFQIGNHKSKIHSPFPLFPFSLSFRVPIFRLGLEHQRQRHPHEAERLA